MTESRETDEAFKKAIWDNYRERGRAFPWRETSDPYAILVSEIMLQQTQTDRVVPKYRAWLDLFPTVQSLATAQFSDVLSAWVGLGYNRRARFLQEACKRLVADYGGSFPREPTELERLPGIGPYTARAVSTFAFGAPNAFIETNIRAVYLFFFFADREGVSDKELLETIGRTVDRDNPREWYYALMDYGAELKKKIENPNRKSRHYAKQSAFEGSERQARGAIVRYLATRGNATLDDVASVERIDRARLDKAARSLVAEGLVAERDGVYRIS